MAEIIAIANSNHVSVLCMQFRGSGSSITCYLFVPHFVPGFMNMTIHPLACTENELPRVGNH